MKIAVYTSITAEKDSLKEPLLRSGADLVLFSDAPHQAPGWDVRPACDLFTDPRRNARAHKLLAHQYLPGYDYSLWLDGSIRVLSDVEGLISTYLRESDIAVFKHSARECIYNEAAACTKWELDDPVVITTQMAKYHQACYPTDNGLIESGVILRRHSTRIEFFNNAWWSELCRYSRRDQLSMSYVLDALGIRPEFFPGTIYDNPGLVSYEHHLK